MTKSTRSVVEGAFLAAITVVLAIISLYLPIGLLDLLLPVPLLVLVYRHGWQLGIMAAFVAAVLTGIFSNLVWGVLLVMAMGGIGLAMGLALKEGFGAAKTVLVGTAASLAIFLLSLGFSMWVLGINDLQANLKMMEESIRQAAVLYSKLATPAEAQRYKELSIKALYTLYPLGLVCSALVTSFLTLFFSRAVLERLGHQIPWFEPFRQWRMPNKLRWPMVIGLVVAGGLYYLPYPWGKMVAYNLLFAYLIIYATEGLALGWFYLEQLMIPKPALVILSLLALSGPGPYFLAWLGFADHMADYRARHAYYEGRFFR